MRGAPPGNGVLTMVLGMRSLVRVGLGLTLCAAATVPTAAMAADTIGAVRPSLRPLKVSIAFGKARYQPRERAHLTVTLHNTGSKRLRRIGAECDHMGDPDELTNQKGKWGPLGASARGVTLAPHSTRVVHVSEMVPAAAQRQGQVVAECDFGYRHVESGYRPQAWDSAKVPGQFGRLHGTIRHRTKSGKTVGLGGVRVVLVDPTTCPIHRATARTGSLGNFLFTHQPAGSSYKLYFFLPRGWRMVGKRTNPTNALIFGKDTTQFGFTATRGTPQHPEPPTKC